MRFRPTVAVTRIDGGGDTILGRGPSFFNHCTITSYGAFMWIRNTEENHGNIFVDCHFKGLSEYAEIGRLPDNKGKNYPHAECVLLNCTMENIPAYGWGRIDDGAKTATILEFNSHTPDGQAIDISKRHPLLRQLDPIRDAALISQYHNIQWVLDWPMPSAKRLPFLVDGVIDTTNYETAGLTPTPGIKTVTIFKAGEQTDHYANGVVMTAFKGKLYCMWQSSPKDEDSDDTWVAYSISSDDGMTWSKPQPLAVPTKDFYCTSGGWLVRGDTLIAFIDTWQKGLEPRGGKTNYITSIDGLTWSQMQPVRMADGNVMEGVLEQDPYTLPDGRLVGASHFMPGLHLCPVYTDDPRGISGWQKGRFEGVDCGKTSREIEPSQFVQPDGTIVMLFRDQTSSFQKLASVSSDRGETWTNPALTNFPDGRTKQCAGNLPTSAAYMVSCPANGKRRWPLVLQLSYDGRVFDRAILLRSGSADNLPPRRYEGRYKTLGYSYPKATIWKDQLYISYSTNKEDVECTIVPLTL